MLDACTKYLDEEHFCPHCKEKLSCCSTPPIHVGDGLGWGTEAYFICLNDECSLFKNGWEHIEAQFGHRASYRYMLLPGNTEGTPMMVGSRDAFKGCIIDPESIKLQNERYANEKEAAAKLDTCVADKNLEPVLHLILDEAADRINREKATDLLEELNNLSCIDPLRNHTFKDINLAHRVNLAIISLLKANYKKECPDCMEIIKTQAKVCQHCGKKFE
jgi:hypothetical protein